MKRGVLGALFLLLMNVVLVGCGGGGATNQYGDTERTQEQEAAALPVERMTDYAGNLDRLREIFTRDAAPSRAEQEKYAKYAYEVVDPINVTGDTATLTVLIKPYGSDLENYPEKQWTVKKEGAEWKISSAPLP